jgi:CheY-like chemotaxis protein
MLIAVVVVLAAVRFREPLSRLLDERVSRVSAFGFTVDLRPAEVDAAVQARVADSGPSVPGAGIGSQVVDRATRLAPRLAGRTALWVDDHPENNAIERKMLRQMGLFVEPMTTNADGLAALADPGDHFDLVLSDIGRDDGSPDGLALLEAVRRMADPPPVILYIGRVDPSRPRPPGAFGITDRPDVLLNLVMDALDRG